MKTRFCKSMTGMSMILSALVTTNSASSGMHDFEDCRRASENELNDMRGGFMINAGGLKFLLSLGFDQSTFVNGVLVAKTTINLLPQLNASEMREAIISQMVMNGTGSSSGGTTTSGTASSGQAGSSMGSTTNTAAGNGSAATTGGASGPASMGTLVSTGSSGAGGSTGSTTNTAAGNGGTATSGGVNGTGAASNSSGTPTSTASNTGNGGATSRTFSASSNYQLNRLVQIGPGNTFIPPSVANLAGTMAVIQNTLDNQLIQNRTTINAVLATRDMLRSMAINSALSRLPPNFGR